MQAMRWRGVLGGAAIATVALVTLYTWAASDSPPPDDAQMMPEAVEVQSEGNSFPALVALGREVAPLVPRIAPRYDQETRSAADALLREELVQTLPERIEAIMAAPRFQVPPPAVESDSDVGWARGMFAISRVLRLRMQQQLAEGQATAAWRTAELGLRFTRFLNDRTESLHHLTVAQVSQKEWLEAILAGIEGRQWSPIERRAIAALPGPPAQAARLLRGLRHEFALFTQAIDRSFEALGRPRGRLVYQRNRTKRAWLRSTADLVAALRAGDLAGAQRALGAATATASADPLPFRNTVGYRMAGASVSGLRAPVDQAVAGAARLALVEQRASASP
jgi:hypothetical protein